MNSTKTQRSNRLAKAIAVLGASTLLSCSAVVLLFSQSAMSQQPTSGSEQLLAQRSGSGSAGSDGSIPATSGETSPMTTPGGVTTPNSTGNVEDRQQLSPRLSDDPSDPANRRDGTPVNSTTGVEQRQELSPRLSDDPSDPAVNRSGGTVNNGSAQQRQDLSPQLEDNPNANDPMNPNSGGTPNPAGTMRRGGTSQQPSSNQNTDGGSSNPVRGLW